ncbi:hypothetical protein [Marinobacterium aestuariivivens]|uniref:Transcriptional regulator n=1 Tax=Marinobacterium aestuariivivens TaxID=1698799 RepID=A0ABW2A7J7_9GAMM
MKKLFLLLAVLLIPILWQPSASVQAMPSTCMPDLPVVLADTCQEAGASCDSAVHGCAQSCIGKLRPAVAGIAIPYSPAVVRVSPAAPAQTLSGFHAPIDHPPQA